MLALATSAAAQSLADVARRAEEQRRESDVEPRVLHAPAPPPGPMVLSIVLVEQYVRARLAFADMRRTERALDLRMSKVMRARWVRSYAEFLPVLRGEDAIVDTLASYGFTPESYLAVEAALVRGRTTARRQPPFLIKTEHKANAEFVATHLTFVERALDRGFQAEQKLHSCCPQLSVD